MKSFFQRYYEIKNVQMVIEYKMSFQRSCVEQFTQLPAGGIALGLCKLKKWAYMKQVRYWRQSLRYINPGHSLCYFFCLVFIHTVDRRNQVQAVIETFFKEVKINLFSFKETFIFILCLCLFACMNVYALCVSGVCICVCGWYVCVVCVVV